MAKLTDLPDEILTLIFRNFLSKDLTNHGSLCNWDVERGATSLRANLYRLALVCRRLVKVSLPRLYEQMFSSSDIRRLVPSNINPDSISAHLAHTRYICTATDDHYQQDIGFMERLSSYLVRCVQLRHMHLQCTLRTHSSCKSSQFLSRLGTMPLSQNLESLSLWFHNCTKEHAVLRDLCAFRNLRGLCLHMKEKGWQLERPSRSLEHLGELRIDQFVDVEDAVKCLDLASPACLRTLHISLLQDHDPRALCRILEAHEWTTLERLNYKDQEGSGYVCLHKQWERLPALRHLRLDFAHHNFNKDASPILPKGLESIELLSISMEELIIILALAKEGLWLQSGMKVIELDIGSLETYGWILTPGQSYALLELAREAVLVAQAQEILVEPQNLVEALEDLQLW